MIAVSNASPLIFLAKIGKLHLLERIFDKVLIPEEVYNEVVVKGREKGFPDADIVDEFIKRGFIVVKRVDVKILRDAPIELGEKAAISLALKEGIKDVLIDEAKVRRFARVFGLKSKGTIFLFAKAHSLGYISKDELRVSLLELVRKGYRIREEILVSLLEELK